MFELIMKGFFRRIAKDFKQKELLPLKLLFFVHASTLYVLYPYLTIHMRELGINVEETAIMSAVTPVVAIIMPPLAGMFADHIGNFRILLALFSSLGGAASLLLLLVPVGRVSFMYSENILLDMSCRHAGSLEFSMIRNESCNYVKSLKNGQIQQVSAALETCGFLCSINNGSQFSEPFSNGSIVDLMTNIHSYDIVTSNNITNIVHISSLSNELPLKSENASKENDLYHTSVEMLQGNRYFFPTTELVNFSCFAKDHNQAAYRNCNFGNGSNEEEDYFKSSHSRKNFTMNLLLQDEPRQFLATTLFNWTSQNDSFTATCEDSYSQNKQEVKISVPLGDETFQFSRCSARCLVSVPRKQVCSNLKSEKEYNVSLTFWSYLVIRVFIGMIGGTAFAMFEGAVIAILREQNADYGLQRIYATIGGMISSPLSGLLIDYASKGKGHTDFRPAFYLYAGLKIASGLLMLTINLEFKAPAKNVVSDVMTVLKNIEAVALFAAIFILGTAWGYIESFLFWLLQDLGASRSLMGITITVGGIAGIPLLVLSGPIIDKIGHANVLFIGFIFYAIRLTGYSLIYNPWLCLIFEAMESVTSSLSFTAAVTYAAKLSTTSTDSSIQGLLGGIYFGVGKGAGSLFGGFMMKAIGDRMTYRVFAVVCAVTGVIYFLFNNLYLRKRPEVEGNDIVKKKPKNIATVEVSMSNVEKEKVDTSGDTDPDVLKKYGNFNNNAVKKEDEIPKFEKDLSKSGTETKEDSDEQKRH